MSNNKGLKRPNGFGYAQWLGDPNAVDWTQGQSGTVATGAMGQSVPLAPTTTYAQNGIGATPTPTPTETPTPSTTPTAPTPTVPTTTPTVTPMTYEQYAEQARRAAYDKAAESRRNAMVQNAASYAQGLPTYGARADSLGRMGLQGSGYADYLGGQAYAAKINADSRAMAQEAQAQQTAELQYSQNILQGREAAEQKLLEAINSGLNPSQIKQFAESLGIGDSAYVQMATDTYNNAVQGSISADMTDEYISSLDYDDASKAEITAKRDDATLKTIFTPDADFDTVSAAIANAQTKGTLSEDGVQSAWYSAYIGKIDNKHTDRNSWSVEDIYAMEKEIESAFGSGQLTAKDRESALSYLYQTAGGVVDAELVDNAKRHGAPKEFYDNIITSEGYGSIAKVRISDTDVYVPVNRSKENSDTSRRLSLIAPNAQQGTIASLGDDAYIYLDGGWYYLQIGQSLNGGAEKMKIAIGNKNSPTAADHQK